MLRFTPAHQSSGSHWPNCKQSLSLFPLTGMEGLCDGMCILFLLCSQIRVSLLSDRKPLIVPLNYTVLRTTGFRFDPLLQTSLEELIAGIIVSEIVIIILDITFWKEESNIDLKMQKKKSLHADYFLMSTLLFGIFLREYSDFIFS